MEYVFGPVPSRRLGRSLGIDLVPFKTCTFDCVYCQLGRTTVKTVERHEWVPLDDVLAEVREALSSRPDYLTLSGSGEPTLYRRLGELIDGLRSMTDLPVAVLTNGSLLWDQEVRRQLLGASLVVPSLDAGDSAMFEAVNRPHPDIGFDRLLEGLIDFRKEYRGLYWLEVLLLAGLTDTDDQVRLIGEHVRRIAPDRVQLNTVTRPPAESCAVAVNDLRLAELATRLGPAAEVIAGHRVGLAAGDLAADRAQVLEMIKRRPCTLDDIAEGLGLHRNAVVKCLEELNSSDRLTKRWSSGKLFYCGSPCEGR